jgi:hypothetical protein
MSHLQTIGSTSAIEQGKKKQFQRGGGESEVWSYRGPKAAVTALYDAFKQAALIDPTIAVLDMDEGRGLATLTVNKATEQALLGVTSNNGITTVYELIPNEFSKRPELAPYFQDTTSGVITNDQIRAAYNAHADQSLNDEAALTSRYSLAGKSLTLFQILESGVEEYLESAYVLRETKVVSGRNAVQANFSNINRVDNPPSNAAVNTLIGSLNERGGEWLKKAPSIRQITKTKWSVVTEWWWAYKWSQTLYGGTLSP